MGPDTEVEKLEAAIKKEQAKVDRCRREGLRHKNHLPKLMTQYSKLMQSRLRQRNAK